MCPWNMEESELMERTPCCELVGCILHLSDTAPPDKDFSAWGRSRFMSNPGKAYWKAAKHVIRYLNSKPLRGLRYMKTKHKLGSKLEGYSDSDFARDIPTRKSANWHCCLHNGTAVSWRCKKQSIVAQSTAETEYVAISFAVREALLLRKVTQHYRGQVTFIHLRTDN